MITDWLKWIGNNDYKKIIEITGFDPRGCGKCEFGIISEPDGLDEIPAPHFLKRAIAAAHGAVVFCDCAAGRSSMKHVEKTLMRIPAAQLNPDSGLRLLSARNDGRVIWATGEKPVYYVPRTVVEAVMKLINKPPTFHVADDEEEEDIF